VRLRSRLSSRYAPLLATSLAVAGCGGGAKTAGNAVSTAVSPKTIIVVATEFRISPSTSHVKLGTYKFKGVNKGTIPHVVELEGPGLESETDTIKPGESYTIELTLHEPGEYELYCPLDDHKKKGMVTDFIVER
jgi:plastocyanin